jgi:hypothetical protein
MKHFTHQKLETISCVVLVALFVLLGFAEVRNANAATITASPKAISVTSGETFSVRYSVDPQGEKIYTVKLMLSFPAKLFRVASAQFASGWMPLSEPGYDLVDSAKGVLIKTAGYPAGISAQALFATVRFQALGNATGTISMQNGSLALDANSTNALAGGPVPSTVVSASLAVATSTVTGKQNLFDVAVAIAPPQKTFDWIPWIVLTAFLLCLALLYVIWIRRRRREQETIKHV